MLTDSPPRKSNRAGFLESDRIRSAADRVSAHDYKIHRVGNEGRDKSGCPPLLHRVSDGYLGVLQNADMRCPRARSPTAASPRKLGKRAFRGHNPETMLIRVWMRTAVRKEITSFGTFLSTLCHEFCHHLDFQRFGFPDSWHTRGFYERTAALYHHARGTAPKRLFWLPTAGGRWRIDWPRTNRG
jgi:hypothetical protein